MIYIKNACLLSGGQELDAQELLIKNGKVLSLGADEEVLQNEDYQELDLKGQVLSPAFIDIQINGGYTRYFSQTPDLETLKEMDEACRSYATPYYYVTLISSPLELIYKAIDSVREAQKHCQGLLGMHLEGPFLAKEKKGAHNADIIRKPDDETLRELVRYANGVIKLITIAPEHFSLEQIKFLQDNGIQVSLGHSNATYEEAQECFANGVNIVTHLYNAMSAFTHRKPSLVGAALENDAVYTPLILDGGHCHWGSACLAYKMKGEKLILITDATVLGRQMKEMPFDGLHAILNEEGFYLNPEGNLAGSAISMGEAVLNAVEHLGVSLAEAIDMASGRVAKAIGREEELGAIAEGYPAVFALYNEAERSFSLLDLRAEA